MWEGKTVFCCRCVVLGLCVLGASRVCAAAPGDGRVVRLAELEIDPVRLEEYEAALRAEVEASIRVEPGVLTLYAVSVKGHANQIRIFEIYASAEAYRAHLETKHFEKYKAETSGMVKSLTLVETDAVVLGAK